MKKALIAISLMGKLFALNEPLCEQLKALYEEDQAACQKWIDASEDEKSFYSDEILALSEKNNPLLKEIVDLYGWPPLSEIGEAGSDALWLLIQHQDDDVAFQRGCLERLKERVDQKEALYKNYAYLFDRVAMNQGLAQHYGTQWVGERGSIELYQVDDMESVERRREEAALPTLAEYKALMKEVYHLNDEDFKN